MPKTRKIPQRTCVGCQSVRPKRELIRIVRTTAGPIEIDATGKKSGRGAYICPQQTCLEKALTGHRLEKALETAVPPEVKDTLRKELAEIVR